MTLSTVEKKYYESTRNRAQGFIDRRTAAYKAEVALHQKTVDECTAKLAEHAVVAENAIAAKSDVSDMTDRKVPLPVMKKGDRL